MAFSKNELYQRNFVSNLKFYRKEQGIFREKLSYATGKTLEEELLSRLEKEVKEVCALL